MALSAADRPLPESLKLYTITVVMSPKSRHWSKWEKGKKRKCMNRPCSGTFVTFRDFDHSATVFQRGWCSLMNICWFSNADGAWTRTLVGKEGVVSSYNFPLNYGKDLFIRYIHSFEEFADNEVTAICLRFKRSVAYNTMYPRPCNHSNQLETLDHGNK